MVWELQETHDIQRAEGGVDFGMSAWTTRDYQFVREVLFNGSTDHFTLNIWRRQRDK